MKFFLAAFTLCICAAVASNVPFTDCSGGKAKASVKSLSATPFPPQKGKSITISAKGQLNEEVTAATYSIVVKYAGVQLLKKQGNLCKLSKDFQCPHPAGPLSLSDSIAIPSIAPSGQYVLEISGKDQDQNTLLCVSIKTSISEPEPVFLADSAAPHGSYCGSLSGVLKMKIAVVTPTSASISATILGSQHSCPNEKIAYDSANHMVTLPHANSKGDCAGALFSSFGVAPSSVKISYNPTTNTLQVNSKMGNINMKQC